MNMQYHIRSIGLGFVIMDQNDHVVCTCNDEADAKLILEALKALAHSDKIG